MLGGLAPHIGPRFLPPSFAWNSCWRGDGYANSVLRLVSGLCWAASRPTLGLVFCLHLLPGTAAGAATGMRTVYFALSVGYAGRPRAPHWASFSASIFCLEQLLARRRVCEQCTSPCQWAVLGGLAPHIGPRFLLPSFAWNSCWRGD